MGMEEWWSNGVMVVVGEEGSVVQEEINSPKDVVVNAKIETNDVIMGGMMRSKETECLSQVLAELTPAQGFKFKRCNKEAFSGKILKRQAGKEMRQATAR